MAKSDYIRKPLMELPADIAPHRSVGRQHVAAILGISLSKVDELEYGNTLRGVPPKSGPPSHKVGKRRLWRVKDVVKWQERQARNGRK